MEEKLRQGFHYFNHFMLLLWRLGLGKWVNSWPSVGGQIMILGHTGRKSGKPYQTPVNYALVDGELYCTAGFGPISDWYRNVTKNPHVEVWLPNGRFAGYVQEITDPILRPTILRQVLLASGFAAPAAGLNPRIMSNEAITAATHNYRLLHIIRTVPRTGSGGPGDLAWVWPLTAVLLFFWWLLGKKRATLASQPA